MSATGFFFCLTVQPDTKTDSDDEMTRASSLGYETQVLCKGIYDEVVLNVKIDLAPSFIPAIELIGSRAVKEGTIHHSCC